MSKVIIYSISVFTFLIFLCGYACYEDLRKVNDSLKEDNDRLLKLLSEKRNKNTL